MLRGRGPRKGKACASKVPQPSTGRNRTGRPLKTQTWSLEMERDSRVVYPVCSQLLTPAQAKGAPGKDQSTPDPRPSQARSLASLPTWAHSQLLTR